MGQPEELFYSNGSLEKLNIFVIKFSVFPKLLEVSLLFTPLTRVSLPLRLFPLHAGLPRLGEVRPVKKGKKLSTSVRIIANRILIVNGFGGSVTEQ